MKHFPRVLIVTKSQIGDIDSAGASLRNWFKEWPRDRVAQIFSGVPLAGSLFCERSIQLGPDERRFGSAFFRLKGSSLGDAAHVYRTTDLPSASPSGFERTLRWCGRKLTETGVWEVVFEPILSDRLRRWIEEFRPEAMFVQGCDISFMRLPMLIKSKYGTPIHFDVVDDWVQHLYRRSFVGPMMNRVVRRTFSALVHASVRRYTIGGAMADAYRSRYGVPFVPLMQCDDAERFRRATDTRQHPRDTVEIVYSGSLALGRWKAILDLAEACAILRSRGLSIAITVYAPFVPDDAVGPLQRTRDVRVRRAVPDAEVPSILKGADLLFLPESFDARVSDYIKLSVSTKAHLYMMSGRPALVYGPPDIATVEYARSGWGLVVDRQGSSNLANAIERLLGNTDERESIVSTASKIAAANHDGPVVREFLRRSLAETSA